MTKAARMLAARLGLRGDRRGRRRRRRKLAQATSVHSAGRWHGWARAAALRCAPRSRSAGPPDAAGVGMSSTMLMPPTKATRPSATASLRCSRRRRWRRSGRGELGAVDEHLHARRQQRRQRRREIAAAEAVHRTRTVDPARAARRARGDGAPVASSSKM
jgi:hypothetical protein